MNNITISFSFKCHKLKYCRKIKVQSTLISRNASLQMFLPKEGIRKMKFYRADQFWYRRQNRILN